MENKEKKDGVFSKAMSTAKEYLPHAGAVIGLILVVVTVLMSAPLWAVITSAILLVVSIGFLIYRFLKNRPSKKGETVTVK